MQKVTLNKVLPELNILLSWYQFNQKSINNQKELNKVHLPLPNIAMICQKEWCCCSKNVGAFPLYNVLKCLYKYLFFNKLFLSLSLWLKHKGSSVDIGHYVMEAMEWATGLWFLFDDKTKILSLSTHQKMLVAALGSVAYLHWMLLLRSIWFHSNIGKQQYNYSNPEMRSHQSTTNSRLSIMTRLCNAWSRAKYSAIQTQHQNQIVQPF